MRSEYYGRWALLATVFLPIFWFFRMPTNLLGDGYQAINNIGNDIPVIFKWSEMGALKFVYFVSQLFPFPGLKGAEYAYATISVFSGTLTMFFFCGIAHSLGRNGTDRFLILCMLIFSGWTLLFFGYAESYPLLWPLITGYIYFSILYINGRCSFLFPTFIIILAMLVHLQTLFLLPAYFLLMFLRGPLERFYNNHKKIVWLSISIFGLVGAAIFIWRWQQSISFQSHFLPIFKGRPPNTEYSILSVRHLIDILNQFSLLIPLWPVFLILFFRKSYSVDNNSVFRFLLVFSLGGIIFLLIIDPKMGLGRDWDLFALTCFGPMLLLLGNFIRIENRIKKLYPVMILASAILVFPFFSANLSYGPSIEYYKWLLRLEKHISRTGLFVLRDYYRNVGEFALADSMNYAITQASFKQYLMGRTIELARSGHPEIALVHAHSIYEMDPLHPDSHGFMGKVYLYRGDIYSALDHFEKAVQLQEYNHRRYLDLGEVYYELKMYREAFKIYKKAEKFNPRSPDVIESLMMGSYKLRQYTQSLDFGQRLIQTGQHDHRTYFITGSSAYNLGHYEAAKGYLIRYLACNPPDGPNKENAIKALYKIKIGQELKGNIF